MIEGDEDTEAVAAKNVLLPIGLLETDGEREELRDTLVHWVEEPVLSTAEREIDAETVYEEEGEEERVDKNTVTVAFGERELVEVGDGVAPAFRETVI